MVPSAGRRWLGIDISLFNECTLKVGRALSSIHLETLWGRAVIIFYKKEETEAQRGQVTGVESYGLTVAQLKLDPGLPIPSPVLFLPLNSHFTTSLE